MNKEAEIQKEHYFDRKYLKKERMFSFVEQIELVKEYVDVKDSILEIGKGNGFVSAFLNQYLGYNIKTVDVNKDLKPDILDDVIKPAHLKSNSYDAILCFEVLEHMPFEKSITALNNMCNIARKFVIISIPDMRYFITFRSLIFGTAPISFSRLISSKRFRNARKKFGSDHFWEIGLVTDDKTYSPKFLAENLFKGKNVIKDYRDISVPWHHYFVIKVDI